MRKLTITLSEDDLTSILVAYGRTALSYSDSITLMLRALANCVRDKMFHPAELLAYLESCHATEEEVLTILARPHIMEDWYTCYKLMHPSKKEES